MNKTLFFLFFLIGVCSNGTAQDLKNDNLGVLRSEKKQEELFNELRTAKADTNKVKLLISLCGFHWYFQRNKDSVARYAQEARKLSQVLNFKPGYYEASFILCKNYLYNGQINRASDLIADMPGDQQARFLLAIGERYLFLPGLEKHNLDSAFVCFNNALKITSSIGAINWKHETLIALGKYYFSIDQFNKAKESFLEIIHHFQNTGDHSREAHYWHELGIYMPDTDSTLDDELWAHGNALRIYRELKDTANEVSVLQDIAAINMYHANFETSKLQLLQVIRLSNLIGRKRIWKNTISLAWICHATGNLDEALSWALQSEKNVKTEGSGDLEIISLSIGQIYGDDGLPEKSLQYLLKAQNSIQQWIYFVCSKIVEQYIILNSPKKALQHIRETEKKVPAVTALDKETVAALKGDVYAAMNNPALAEKYYLQMMQLDHEAQKSRSREIIPITFSLAGSEAYYKIANFYEGQNQPKKAGQYADRALEIHSFPGNHFYTAHLMKKIWWLKFKIDSATGNYIAAIRNYEKYTALKDSIFTAAKSNQLLQIQVKYDTEKKETEIKNRDHQIQALTQTESLRQANLEQANLIRNISISLLAVLLILGGLLYKQYRQKQKSAQLIAETNKVISQKNQAITQKNEALENLVTEKEWLLKEVHHRVKNNLHTVICLLESQAAYLENDAREANEISQQRIYAMSLIHQKIYQSDDIKSIDMSVYLPELVQHLDDSFGNNRRIHFELDVDRVTLDISQAIPVALIINEAVTNSIKYAFPGNMQGSVKISLYRTGEQISLVISDNGIGIDTTVINSSTNSLGMQLIKGLSKDIKARLQLDNDRGTRISVVFHLNQLNENDYRLKMALREDEIHVQMENIQN